MAKITLTPRTKKYRFLGFLFSLLSLLCLIAPLAVFSGVAISEGIFETEAFALGATVLITLILSVICAINKVVMKSKIWIIVIALYVILDHFLPVLLVIAACQILDEIIISPLARYCKDIYRANKEIDRRP